MITSSFSEWVKTRQLNEVYAQGQGVGGTFGNLSQKEGDIVLYNVHELSKMAKELQEGESFPELSLGTQSDRIGVIVGANPVKRRIIATRPQTLSYQRFKKSRGKDLQIPLKSLENVSDLFPDDELTEEIVDENGNKEIKKKNVWLAVDDNTPYQGRLAEAIRKSTQAKYNQPSTEPEPQPQDVFPASALQTPTQSVAPVPNWRDLGLEEPETKPPLTAWRDKNKDRINLQQIGEPKFQMQGREVIPTDSNQMAALGQGLRHHRKQTVDPEVERIKKIMVSSYDPSIMSNDNYWKFYTEAKTYVYH